MDTRDRINTRKILPFLNMEQQGWLIMGVRGEQQGEEEENRDWVKSRGTDELAASDRAGRGRKEDEGNHRCSKRLGLPGRSSCLPTIAEDQELTLERRRRKPNLELFTIHE